MWSKPTEIALHIVPLSLYLWYNHKCFSTSRLLIMFHVNESRDTFPNSISYNFLQLAFHKSFPTHTPYVNSTLPNLIPSHSSCQQLLHSQHPPLHENSFTKATILLSHRYLWWNRYKRLWAKLHFCRNKSSKSSTVFSMTLPDVTLLKPAPSTLQYAVLPTDPQTRFLQPNFGLAVRWCLMSKT